MQHRAVKRPRPLYSLAHGGHRALLVSFIFLFIITPFVADMRYGAAVLAATGGIVMLCGLYALSAKKRFFVAAVIGAIAIFVINTLVVAKPSNSIIIVSHVVALVLYSTFAIAILTDVLRAGRITADKIYGAICVYLSLGFVWTFAYSILFMNNPDAFGGLAVAKSNDYIEHVLALRYFSFITLATVGYGDILPKSVGARTLATLEAMVGQFYLAILVARLVGLHIMHQARPEDD